MELKQLTEEMHRFVEAKGWYAPGSSRPQTPRNLAISLTLEAAEVLEHFQWSDGPVDSLRGLGSRDELAGELADVLLYLMQLASLSDIDLEQAVLAKLAVNYGRNWPDREP